jgi:phosphoribosylformimino-5-aminoimidazole carboxamide ribotide isomerase
VQVIPAVDMVGEDATRLEQGDFDRELFRRPAVAFVRDVAATQPPMIHLVDLDGARSGQPRLSLLAACLEAAQSIPVQVSGGIRTVATARAVLDLGAARVLIGTAAFADPDRLIEFVEACGDQLAVTIDVRDGHVKVGGWLHGTGFSVADAAAHCVNSGVQRVMGTAIDRDGTLGGPDLDLYRALCAFPLRVIAAGGVRGPDDVAALDAIGCEAVVTGRAFVEGHFDLKPA